MKFRIYIDEVGNPDIESSDNPQKANNISGLQLADLLAHPSRNEILKDQGLLDKEVAPFAQRVIAVLQAKYDKEGERIFGKKFL